MIGCIHSDLVSNVFSHGEEAFQLNLQEKEVQDVDEKDRPGLNLSAVASLTLPSCPKPDEDFIYGTEERPDLYSLHPCECFGAAFADEAPVTETSDVAVPKDAAGTFNVGPVPDIKLLQGPYTCEENAQIARFQDVGLSDCQQNCESSPDCKFYIFGEASDDCTLYKSCDYIQHVGLQIVNSLYGKSPKSSSFCRIADPEGCWANIRRRSMLSFKPSDLPECLFQMQLDACDALQLLHGQVDGTCTRCLYIDASTPFASKGLTKVPLPETFPSGAQLVATCNDTSRMFAKQEGDLVWEGMEKPANFVCVSGKWEGSPGPGQSLANLMCERCIQVGSPRLQLLSRISMPEVFFLEHRKVHVTYPFASPGCTSAVQQTQARLRSTSSEMYVVMAKEKRQHKLSLQPNADEDTDTVSPHWYTTRNGELNTDVIGLAQIREFPDHDLYVVEGSSSVATWTLQNNGLLKSSDGKRCALAVDNAIRAVDCPEQPGEEFRWYLAGGDCILDIFMANTAAKLWSVKAETVSKDFVSLGHLAFRPGHSSLHGASLFGSCEASISVDANESDVPSDLAPLDLQVESAEELSVKERAAYTHVPALAVYDGVEHFQQRYPIFIALPGQGNAKNTNTTVVAHKVAVQAQLVASKWPTNQDRKADLLNLNCPAWLQKFTHVNPAIAANSASGGIAMPELMNIYQDTFYPASRYSNPTGMPFDCDLSDHSEYVGVDRCMRFGFLSVTPNGGVWGLRCPPGSVVASDNSMMPYCLQLGANMGPEQEFQSFSGSMDCPAGSAVSGWYNLPGIPVKANSSNGPGNFTGTRLWCRSTPLLSSCEQPTAAWCQTPGVVVSVSFDSNQFKLGCCQVQRRLGMALGEYTSLSETTNSAGYYCPARIDNTGAPIYSKAFIASLGEPENSSQKNGWTVKWDRWKERWLLEDPEGTATAFLPGSALSPAWINASGFSFSATFIEPLTAAYLTQQKPDGPFPKQKPTMPKLVPFRSEQPDYKEYCDPAFLEDPSQYPAAESMAETNPCYHVFNSMPANLDPEVDLPKGITEQSFWQCSERSKRRTFMSAQTQINLGQEGREIDEKLSWWGKVKLTAELAGAILGMIPWGSWSAPNEKSAEIAQENVKEKVEEEVKKTVSQKIKAFWKEKLANKEWWSTGLKNLKESTMKNITNGGASYAFKKAGKNKVWDKITAFPGKWSAPGAPNPPSPGQWENMSEELIKQTVPELNGDYDKDMQSLADASWKDCLPLQFGLSKVMCDLFCIQDSVRAGTSAVLSSLQDSHAVLMTNMQALLNYQTQLLLWTIGSVLQPQEAKKAEADVLSAPALLDGMRQLDLTHLTSEGLNLGLEVLDWHKTTGDQLLSRMAGMFINVSLQNWPHRRQAMKGMLHHYERSLHERLGASASSAPQKQMNRKLEHLRDQSFGQREAAHAVKSLQAHSSPRMMSWNDPASVSAWMSILESFLRCHEKHDAFTMLHLKALDQVEYAVTLAKNFSRCEGADTVALRESWQRAMRAEERSNEALLEAWSASIATSEHLGLVMDQGFLSHLVANLEFSEEGPLERCENGTRIAQRLYGHAVSVAVSALQPLALQLNTFQVLATYQEYQLKHRKLRYIPLNLDTSELKTVLADISNPKTPNGRALALRAVKTLGKQMCPEILRAADDAVEFLQPEEASLLLLS